MRCMLLLLYCCSFLFLSCQARYDAAYVYGTRGRDVVLRCTKLISNAGIFRDDGGFARILAYVQSRDGATLSSDDNGGIWKVTRTQLEKTVDFQTCRSSQFYEEIYEKFAINWTQVTMEQLQIPLYSAIASKLFVEIACRRMQIPTSISEQFEFWKINYGIEKSAPQSVDEFQELISRMSNDCSVRVRDVIIAVDASWKASLVSMLRLKEFLFNLVENWRIGDVRVGLVQFAQSTYLNLRLDVGISADRIRSGISRLQMHHEKLSDVTAAVNFTLNKFLPAYGGRKNDRSKVLLLITGNPQGNSHKFYRMSREENVELITVSIGNRQIVRQVAHERRMFTASSYERLEEIESSVQRAICDARVYVTNFGTIDERLVGGESILYEIVITTRYYLQIVSNSSNIGGYISYNHSDTPDSAYYDVRLRPAAVFSPQFSALIRIENGGKFAANFSLIIFENYVEFGEEQKSIRGPLMIAAIIFAAFLVVMITSLVTSRYCYCENAGKVASSDGQREENEDEIVGGVGGGRNVLDGRERFREDATEDAMFDPNQFTIVTQTIEAEEKTKKFPQIETTGPNLYAVDQCEATDENVIPNNSNQCAGGLVEKKNQLVEETWMNVAKYGGPLQQNCKEGKSDLKRDDEKFKSQIERTASGDLGVRVEISEKYLNETIILQEAKANLATAVQNRDIEITKKRKKEFQEISKLDDDEIDRFVQVLQFRTDLQQSIEFDDLPNVEVLLELVKEEGLEEELKEDLDVVTSFRERHHEQQSKTTKRIKKELMKMNQTRVSEIRSYLAPPSGVQELMTAVLILLGYPDNSLNDWTKIQAIMGQTGKRSITRQLYQCNPRSVDYERAMEAKEILQQFNIQSVQELSSGLAMFYVFAQTVIKAVEAVPTKSFNSSELDAVNHVKR